MFVCKIPKLFPGKIWTDYLDNFNKHKPLMLEEWNTYYIYIKLSEIEQLYAGFCIIEISVSRISWAWNKDFIIFEFWVRKHFLNWKFECPHAYAEMKEISLVIYIVMIQGECTRISCLRAFKIWGTIVYFIEGSSLSRHK